MPNQYVINVTISNGAISCDLNGGNLHIARGDTITWNGGSAFKLAFHPFPTNNKGNRQWPFDEQEPTGAQKQVKGTRTRGGGVEYWKYTITDSSGTLVLDPIIIVDK